jgi:Na+-transporting methylmalonyl-CoA/oxaloacetate decarboxylase gamma subunit
VAGYGPSDDFNKQQTTKAASGMNGAPSDTPPDQSETPQPHHEGFEPAPWYRSPPLLIAWVLLVLILIALIVYGVGELIGGSEGTSPAPSSTTFTTTAPASTTTTATTTTPPVSTTTETTPPTSSAVQPPTQQQPTQQPTSQPTQKHHPHLPQLPPGIKLPF